MIEGNKRTLIELYNERFQKYGHDQRSLGWSKQRQPIRFKILSEIGRLDNCSILDAGCGFGDLYGFLVGKGLKIAYTGYDINPNFIQIAKEIYPKASFEVKDILEVEDSEKFDYVLSSGLLEFKLPGSESFAKNLLKKMFGLCKNGVAADFLSSYVDWKDERANYFKPENIFYLSKTLSKRVTLRHDYMPFEFCVYIYKEDEINERNVFDAFEEDMKKANT
jgi:SAM-dependent methyltransferase